MKVGVPREPWPGERRVALIPAAAASLEKTGLDVVVEQDAGLEAGFPSAAYEAAGASGAPRRDVFASADILLQVRSTPPETPSLPPGQTIVGLPGPPRPPPATPPLARRAVLAAS